MAPKAPALDDAWDTWLAYASWLSAQGDVRGELLVLGNTLASSLENEALRAEIDERAVAWYENSELSDADEDLLYMYWEMAKGFRRFRNTVIPEDLARLFKIPSAQLIATLPISGDLDAPASSVLGHHTRDIHNALIGWIEKAFDGVPVPQAPSRTLYQAEAWDDYEFCDRSRDHMGRWQDLPEQHLLDCNWSLSYLDEHGIHYYFPAVMCFDLRYGLAAPGGWLLESLEHTLVPSGGLLDRFRIFDEEQRATIAAYTLVSGNTKAFEAWGRVMETPQNNTPQNNTYNWFSIWIAPRGFSPS